MFPLTSAVACKLNVTTDAPLYGIAYFLQNGIHMFLRGVRPSTEMSWHY